MNSTHVKHCVHTGHASGSITQPVSFLDGLIFTSSIVLLASISPQKKSTLSLFFSWLTVPIVKRPPFASSGRFISILLMERGEGASHRRRS